jgi:hypothetical protein
LRHRDVHVGSTFGLVVTSIALDQRARQAQTAAVALDVKEAPVREARTPRGTGGRISI